MSAQLVYWQVPHRRPKCRPPSEPLSELRSVVLQQRAVALCLVGAIAQYDECEEDIDPETHVPVRYRGRVMAAPLSGIRPVH